MKPRRTPESDVVFQLPGGNEDNDLWARRGVDGGLPFVESVWELDESERETLAAGGTIELRVYTDQTPPVSLAVGPSLAVRRTLV